MSVLNIVLFCAAGFLLAYGLAQLDRKIHTEE